MRRLLLIGTFIMGGVLVWAGLSKEDWASLTLSRGFVPGETVSIAQWNEILDKLKLTPAIESSNSNRSPVDEAWASVAQKYNFEDKPTYSHEEWTVLLGAVESDTPLPQAPVLNTTVTSSTDTVVSSGVAPAILPAIVAAPLGEAPSFPPDSAPNPPNLLAVTESAPPPLPPPPPPRPTKTISLDLREMDVVEVLKILSRQSGMNIVVGRNVMGRVTVFLKDVDLWDALQTILETRDLAYVEKGGLITILTAQDYEKVYGQAFGSKTETRVFPFKSIEAARAKVLLEPFRSKVGSIAINEGTNTLHVEDTSEVLIKMEQMIAGFDVPMQTRVFTINHGSVEEMMPKVSPMVSRDYGNIQADKRSNSIVVTDNPARLLEIAHLIESFDVRDRAVLIEAKIVQIILNDDYQWGINWQYVFNRVAGNALRSPIIGSVTQNLLTVPLTDLTPDINGQVKAKGVTGNVNITKLPHGASFSSIINFLDTMGKTKMLSSPRIMALNNREAKIHVGTNEPILTRNIVNAGSSTIQPIVTEDVKFEPVGVSLAVTPSIGSDGFLTMKIRPEVSSVQSVITTENGSSIPIVRTSEVETHVLVKDGVTVVIGGLIEDQKIVTDTHVPILGKIPLIGMAFRNRSRTTVKTELFVFLTPRIVTGDVDAPESEVYLPPYEKVLEKKPRRRGFFYRMFHRKPRGH